MRNASSARRTSADSFAMMATANSAALRAPAVPMAKVATGIPLGICAIERSESMPPSVFVSTGTPSTGTVVLAAVIPGRCAAPPAPAMMAFRPRSRAEAAYSNSRSGVRCAEITRTSCAIPKRVNVSAADCIVSQSEDDPIMTPTTAFIVGKFTNLSEQLAQKREKFPGADRRALFRALFFGLIEQFRQRAPIGVGIFLEQFVHRHCGFRQQAIAPALNLLEMANFQIMALLALGHLGEHRFRIDVAHQFADVLPLTDLGAVRGQAAQAAQRNKQ